MPVLTPAAKLSIGQFRNALKTHLFRGAWHFGDFVF